MKSINYSFGTIVEELPGHIYFVNNDGNRVYFHGINNSTSQQLLSGNEAEAKYAIRFYRTILLRDINNLSF